MEPQPVEQHQRPRYPTRREVLAGAASFALVNLAGCNFVVAEPESGKIVVAPIFEHGCGRGATGCDVVTPPVFLSEEEGMQILREELSRHGIQLKAGGDLEGVVVPARLEKLDHGKVSVVEVSDKAKPLKLSGMDAEKRIAIEFISATNYDDLGGLGGGLSGKALKGYYDPKDVAGYVAAQAKKQGKDRVFLGVFYDPGPQDGTTDRRTQADQGGLQETPPPASPGLRRLAEREEGNPVKESNHGTEAVATPRAAPLSHAPRGARRRRVVRAGQPGRV